MRQLFLSFILLCGLYSTTIAQTDANRTTTTKIADLLAKTPAEDATQLKANAVAVADLGASGIAELAEKLNAGGDDTRLHYAINGFSYFATQTGNEAWRDIAVKGYGQALTKLTDKEAQLFIITQLEHVGKDDAISYLQPFLKDDRLSDAAARALATIKTDASNKALVQALSSASGNAQLSIIQALGDTRYREAAEPIAALATSSDAKTAKVALYTLANIGDPSSAKILSDAAAKSGYTYDVTDATASYIKYLNQLVTNGNTTAAEKAAKQLLKTAKDDTQVHTRTAALKILTGIQGEKSTALLTSAMRDNNAEYREAALKFAQPYINDASAAQWLKAFNKSGAAPQAEMMRMFGNNGVKAALPVVLQSLNSKDENVKLAAIAASGKIGQQEALPALLGLLKTATPDEATAVKSALLSLKGDDVVSKVGGALSDASPAGKAAVIDVLGARADDGMMKEVLPLMNSADTQVSKSARAAIKQMASPKQLLQLYALLAGSKNAQDASDIQGALIAAFNRVPNASNRGKAAVNLLNKAPEEKKSLFYNVLSGIGGKEGLQTVAGAFASGNDATKKAVITALSNWKGGLGTTQLYQLLQQTGKGSAFTKDVVDGFVKQISISGANGEEKLIMLRDAMEYAQTTDQKKEILSEVEKCKTFQALLYAGSFLDDAAVQKEAGSAVMNIALADKNIYGDNVRALLEKTIGVLKGSESDYQKEAIRKHLAAMPKGTGFVPLFNGKDLSGWKGLVADPVKRAKMDAKTLAKEQMKADTAMRNGWGVKDGLLVFNGHGDNLCTEKKYGDFEMYVDWKITKDGDAGIYLRGTPQVQIWDTSRVDVGAQVGSGGLYNNQKNESKPLVMADNAIGDWNTFHITMVGDQVTVYLNGQLVVNGVPLENYWDRNLPIFPEEQIELQAHGTYVAYRDVYIREIPRPQPYTLTDAEKKDGFKILFDGTNLHEWTGNKTAYTIEDGNLAVYPKKGGSGNLYTSSEYSDFVYRFEFKLTPGANNGVGIRAPLTGDAAYDGMEIQVLDNDADMYKDLKPYQYHGSVYGIIAAKRGFLKPLGEWNEEEIEAKGNKIKVTLNGTVILDGDIAEATKDGTADHREHPGLMNKTGHIGYLGHGDVLYFRNIRIKDLAPPPPPPPAKKKKK
jgi:HEAT repeat protein